MRNSLAKRAMESVRRENRDHQDDILQKWIIFLIEEREQEERGEGWSFVKILDELNFIAKKEQEKQNEIKYGRFMTKEQGRTNRDNDENEDFFKEKSDKQKKIRSKKSKKNSDDLWDWEEAFLTDQDFHFAYQAANNQHERDELWRQYQNHEEMPCFLESKKKIAEQKRKNRINDLIAQSLPSTDEREEIMKQNSEIVKGMAIRNKYKIEYLQEELTNTIKEKEILRNELDELHLKLKRKILKNHKSSEAERHAKVKDYRRAPQRIINGFAYAQSNKNWTKSTMLVYISSLETALRNSRDEHDRDVLRLLVWKTDKKKLEVMLACFENPTVEIEPDLLNELNLDSISLFNYKVFYHETLLRLGRIQAEDIKKEEENNTRRLIDFSFYINNHHPKSDMIGEVKDAETYIVNGATFYKVNNRWTQKLCLQYINELKTRLQCMTMSYENMEDKVYAFKINLDEFPLIDVMLQRICKQEKQDIKKELKKLIAQRQLPLHLSKELKKTPFFDIFIQRLEERMKKLQQDEIIFNCREIRWATNTKNINSLKDQKEEHLEESQESESSEKHETNKGEETVPAEGQEENQVTELAEINDSLVLEVEEVKERKNQEEAMASSRMNDIFACFRRQADEEDNQKCDSCS